MKNESLRRNHISDVALDQERLLVERIRDGDQSALEELIRQYGGKIYYLALQYTRNPQDAEEVLQDVFLKVFRKIDTFRAAAPLSPWLYKIAVNTSLMKLREQKKHRVAATVSLEDWMLARNSEARDAAWEMQLADWSANAQQLLLRQDLQETVRRAIGRLPEIYRAVVQLRDIDGLTLEEISDALEISIPAVKSRLHRARLIIQKTISRFVAQENRKRLLTRQN